MLEEKEYDTLDDDHEFKYLVRMPMDSVSEENVEKLLKEHGIKNAELERVKATTIEEMWLSELLILEQEYTIYQMERKEAQQGDVKASGKKKIVTKAVKKSVKKSILIEEVI
jgi:DNA topoisomerase-2